MDSNTRPLLLYARFGWFRSHGAGRLLSPLLTTIQPGFIMIAEHFRNGDGSPPLTAFTADDSYPDKE